jgi:hypothetical protein
MFSFYTTGENLKCAYPIIKETIPRSSLGYNTNNVYPQFPPNMSDGRAIVASWQPEAVLNNDLLKQSGVRTNLDYRRFLTHNAIDIMTYNMTEACNDVGYYKRFAKAEDMGSNAVAFTANGPHIYSSINDNTPVMGVRHSDLKVDYLTREQLNSKKISPTITQEELLRMGR